MSLIDSWELNALSPYEQLLVSLTFIALSLLGDPDCHLRRLSSFHEVARHLLELKLNRNFSLLSLLFAKRFGIF